MKEINDKILDIDYLIKNNTRLYNFGLGFIQVVLNDVERVHFYSGDKSLQTNDEIYNHRYNFVSHIIKGTFNNNLYDLNFDYYNQDYQFISHLLTNESCNKDKEVSNVISVPVSPIFKSGTWYREGEYYNMSFNEFHTVDWLSNTITYIRRTPIVTDSAQVLIKKDAEKVCPFENKLSEKEIWELVEHIINK
jgi:hypothetical protein